MFDVVIIGGRDFEGNLGDMAAPWADRVDHVEAAQRVNATSLLVRPDGYIAWSSDDGQNLVQVLSRWFGLAPATS